MKRRLLIFGSRGLVGFHIAKYLSEDFEILAPSHEQVDVTILSGIKKYIDKTQPDIVINSAGLANMEMAEKDENLAYSLNVEGCKNILESLPHNTAYYYISTDAVFDGLKKNSPFSETDEPKPICVYAKTKVRGEELTLQASNKNGIIRITLPYAADFNAKSDRVRDLVIALKSNSSYYGITDQTINPIFIHDVVIGIKSIIKEEGKGIYHVAASDSMSNYDFMKLVAAKFLLNERNLLAVKLSDFQKNKAAHRASYCVLGVERFNSGFYNLPTIGESLENFKKENYSNK